MTIDKKAFRKILFISIILFLIGNEIISTRGTNRQYKMLLDSGALTVGVTDGMLYGGQSGRYVQYKYCILGEYYKGSQHYNNWNKINLKNEKFMVVFSQKDPKMSYMLFSNKTSTEVCEVIEEKNLAEAGFKYWDFYWNESL